MLRTVLWTLLASVGALVVLPPVWYALFPVPAPELPPAGRAVELGAGLEVNVLDVGEGPALVLVHGNGVSGYEWVPFQRALAGRGYRVIAYDRVGYGRSGGRSDGSYSVQHNAEDLLALLEAMQLDDVTLVGWSYGGGVSMAAARTDPSRVARLVLVGSVGPGIVDERAVVPDWLFGLVGVPVMEWVSRVPPVRSRLGELAIRASFAPEEVPQGFRERSAASFAMPNTAEAALRENSDLDTPGLLDPADLEVPVLVVHGDADQLSSLAIGRRLAQRAPRAELWVVPGGGHMLPLTRAEPLAERVAAFVASGVAGDSGELLE